ncbi:hypothetical protein [Adhaeribacter soli]|uniref:Uncharacterized protein n=1 Tax=Adhaeribacter soli TaxID=2607655 RepID=A0A5N1J995_9BACT|nr:hypothetical protein [Adhaeribacter soli]KAA9345885.1 hypothetical protein F0P94_02035 [Adhaeribacter soli]
MPSAKCHPEHSEGPRRLSGNSSLQRTGKLSQSYARKLRAPSFSTGFFIYELLLILCCFEKLNFVGKAGLAGLQIDIAIVSLEKVPCQQNFSLMLYLAAGRCVAANSFTRFRYFIIPSSLVIPDLLSEYA